MDMNNFNVSATLNIFRVLAKPTLLLPHATVSTFDRLPIPLNGAFDKYRNVDIRAVVLDKDDCFAKPKTNEIHEPYRETFQRLQQSYPGRRLLIVSNSSGTSSLDPSNTQAQALEAATGVRVLRHSTKKPGCGADVLAYFLAHPETGVTRPDQIAVVGDRLTTDVLMANSMGSYAVWVRDGVVPPSEKSVFSRWEKSVAAFLVRRGYEAPEPLSPFEK